jgi:ribokinase
VTDLPRPFLSIGSINADFQFEVEADLADGGTLPARSFKRRAGGKGANRAFFAQHVGCPALLIGRVGTDDLARQALEPLTESGVDLAGVTPSAGSATGVSMIAVPESGQKTILLAANANSDWDEPSLTLIETLISQADSGAVLTLDFEIAADAVAVALEVAAGRGLRVVADGSFGKNVDAGHLPKLYAIAPNVHEAEAITAMDIQSPVEAEAAARKLVGMGVEIACIKLSEGGCLLATRSMTETIAAPPVDVVDKTGAGDAFTAALAIALLEGKSARDAAVYGVAASTLAVKTKGSQEAYPTRADLDRMAERVMKHGA